MKRMHLHVGVSDLDASIHFYAGLFGADPTVTKPDYAKWMLDDPRINFAISSSEHTAKGIEHIGIQAETLDELGEIYGRLKAAGRPVLEEGQTTCCYAQSVKNWITDPDGVVWVAFLTNGEATAYGDKLQVAQAHASLNALESANASAASCCVPKLA
jgi:catechol 2,3-dioxygenase-like lactoylglutathione lyase family enzyme